MKVEVNADIHHLTRVEGHGNIRIRVEGGVLKQADWTVVETPRFFEVMVKGRSFDVAPFITARICGICSAGHMLASLRAIERALGLAPPADAQRLRLLAKHAETLQSHLLHLFFLVAPDFFGTTSILPLAQTHPEVAKMALELRGASNDLCALVAGRATHPTTFAVGGVTRAPDKAELAKIGKRFRASLTSMQKAVELFAGLKMPVFERETEFVSLQGAVSDDGRDLYPWIGGDLVSTDGVRKGEDDYRAMTNEYVVDTTMSKLARLSRSSFAVGALARFNNNHRFLRSEAKAAAEALGLRAVCHNPFMNNPAQLVECVQVIHDSIELIDGLLGSPLTELLVRPVARAGQGVGAVEVPRGILYHRYQLDERGHVLSADCVIPTTQNNANIHENLKELVAHEAAAGTASERITQLGEMLVRAYDPCISCSVH